MTAIRLKIWVHGMELVSKTELQELVYGDISPKEFPSQGAENSDTSRVEEVIQTSRLGCPALASSAALANPFDSYSRFIVHWELALSMRAQEIAEIIAVALEKVPGKKPRIVRDNGSQFLAKEWREVIRHSLSLKRSPFGPDTLNLMAE